MRLHAFLGIAGLAALLAAQSPRPDPQELWRHRNLGKAFFETPSTIAQAPAELKRAVDLQPDSFRDRVNYGVALLRVGDLDQSIIQLEKAQAQDPSEPHTWFNLGLAYKRQRRYEDAVKQFERMIALVPDEPVAHYNLGLLYNLQGRGNDALRQFEIAAGLGRHLVAPRFQIYTYYRLKNDEDTAVRALAAFQDAKQRQQASDETEDMEWCFYAELYDPSRTRPVRHEIALASGWRYEDHKLARPASNVLVMDADGDGQPDLLTWSRDGIALYRNGIDFVRDSGLPQLTGIISIAAADYDNDGLADLCILTERGAYLYRNLKSRFEKAPVALPQGRYEAAVWLDFDHDYDLDLILLGEKSVLLRNEGTSGFRDYTSHFPFQKGHALSGAALRVIPDTKSIDLAVTYADRIAVLYRDQLRGEFQETALDAIPAKSRSLHALDADNDGWLDLAFNSPERLSLARNRNGHFDAGEIASKGRFTLADIRNDGAADLVEGSASADFDGDGRIDVVTLNPDGFVHVLLNRTTTANNWIGLNLTGVKNLKGAAGAEVEIKAGDHYQKQVYEGVPLIFGLANNKIVDTIRITWPNGTIQNQTNAPAGQFVSIKEAPRLAGSCPMIFTWNGRGFQFITDVLGVAPLGASSGDGRYFPVDHDEYVSIPAEALATRRDGSYDIRITEELHEVSYLDKVQLVALDHSRDTQIFTNEKFKSPPFPEFRLFGVKKRIKPISVAGLRGFEHDAAGVAAMHTLTLDFGKGAAPDNQAVLMLHGWVDWADGSTFMRASQGGRTGLVMPYLQVKDKRGEWRTVIEDMGIPSGKPKTIAVDLSGKFLSSSREIRIVTNLCVYWDDIFLSEDAAPPPLRLTPIDATEGSLQLRGFSKVDIDPKRERPESFDYSNVTTTAAWNQISGYYTRYGDVRELVREVDDKLVIMGAGDELRLRFDGHNLPALPDRWRRDFLLLVDGWAKDADANTALSQTIQPLPFHAMSAYPYSASEHFPSDSPHEAWRKKYNTRPAIRFLEPLLARGR